LCHNGQRDCNLPSTVPEIECQVAQELDIAEININGSSQSAGVPRDVVAEDDASHGALTRTRLAHQQNFLLLLLARLGSWGSGRLRDRFILDVEGSHLFHFGKVCFVSSVPVVRLAAAVQEGKSTKTHSDTSGSEV